MESYLYALYNNKPRTSPLPLIHIYDFSRWTSSNRSTFDEWPLYLHFFGVNTGVGTRRLGKGDGTTPSVLNLILY